MSLVENVDLSTTPATPPPPGVVPDFDNPESLSYLPRSLMYAFVPLMVLFLGLRLWCRWKTKQKLGWDDCKPASTHFALEWLDSLARQDSGITSVASTIAYCGVVYASFDMLYGVHLYEIPVSDLDPFWFEMLIVICILSGISLLLVKLALLVLYLRVFRPIYSVRLTIYSCIGILSAFYFATCVAYLVQCVPETSQNVAVALNTGTCIPSAVDITVVRNFFGAVSDFVILIIPINQVFKLGLVRKKKFAVVGTFMTGLIACGCSLATCLVRIGHTSRDGYGDYTWANTVPVTFTSPGHIDLPQPIDARRIQALQN
ncbi:hypothetical protein S40288_07757 [Stachybotrys chartarum IBT 40288]|nr:hypothetical protein S40288_07757 [Stachybotrys chartarum IBT 40288]